MIPKNVLKKIKQIEITTSRLVSDLFAGQYHSVFKGQGIEFDEVREYQVGDDVRTIDWNVTARTGTVHVKKFIEERELTVMIMVDASRSTYFGSVNALKHQLAAEVSALLALAATRNNDKVGLIIFTDRIEKFIAPRKGRKHVLRMIRDVLYFQPEGQSTDIIGALDYLSKVTTRKTIAFLISDFFIPSDSQNTNEMKDKLKKVLAIANRRHDMTAIALNDPREIELPECGLLSLEDAETGRRMTVDTSNKKLRSQYTTNSQKRMDERQRLFRSIGIDCIDIATNSSYADEIAKFFIKRRKRQNVGLVAGCWLLVAGEVWAQEGLRDIKDPVGLPSSGVWVYFLVGMVLLIGIVGVMVYLRWKKQKGLNVSKRPFSEVALDKLEKLERSEVRQQKEYKLLYTELSKVVREYLEKRFAIKASEMTTQEFLVNIKDSDVLTELHKESLKGFLLVCDLVKFAKHIPEESEIQNGIDQARNLIRETRPVELK